MENVRKEMEGLKQKFRELESRKQDFFKKFADFLLEQEQKEYVLNLPELNDGYERVMAVRDEKQSLINRIIAIKELLKEKERFEEERKETRDSIRELEKANTSLYENMGRAGYQAYKEEHLEQKVFSQVFSTLEEEKEKINTFEVELSKTSHREGNIFKKLMTRSKEVYLKSNQNLRLRNLTRIYQKAGETLGGMPGISWDENESLKHAFLPYYKNREKQDELLGRDENLAHGEKELRNRMEELGVYRNSGKRIQEIEQEILFLDEKQDQEKIYFGQSWWAIDKKKRKEFKTPAYHVKEKNSLDKAELLLVEEQAELERIIRRQELSGILNVQEKEASRISNRIDQLQNDLDRKKSEIEQSRNELKELSPENSGKDG